jgi:hypothetical protein
MTQSNVEAEIVANMPNGTDQSGHRFRLSELFFVEELRNRPAGCSSISTSPFVATAASVPSNGR